jgi:hypothetical protein
MVAISLSGLALRRRGLDASLLGVNLDDGFLILLQATLDVFQFANRINVSVFYQAAMIHIAF